jgi:formylglycine-generating enzyme required for sulfatase activity
MAGNVWEWLADEAGAKGQARQLRGGAWFYTADFARLDYEQFWREPDYRQDVIGFRLCFSQTQQEEKE